MPRPATDTRDKILHAARDLFADKGVDGTSIRLIARTAGVNLGMIHYFFPSKDQLVESVLETYFGSVAEALAAIPAGKSPRQRMEALIRAIVGYVQANQTLIRIVMREVSVQSPRLRNIALKFIGPNFGRLATIVSEGIGSGDFKPLDVRFLAMATVGMMIHPFVARPLIGQFLGLDFTSKEFAEGLTQTILSVLFEGILRRRGRSRH